MTDSVFVARLFIAVAADGEGEACDAFSETLRTLMIDGHILDWQYSRRPDGTHDSPVLVDMTLEQGDDEDYDKQYAFEQAVALNAGARCEIQMIINDGWSNVWNEDDVPLTFDTLGEAKAALEDHLRIGQEAFRAKFISEAPDRDHFRIRALT